MILPAEQTEPFEVKLFWTVRPPAPAWMALHSNVRVDGIVVGVGEGPDVVDGAGDDPLPGNGDISGAAGERPAGGVEAKVQ